MHDPSIVKGNEPIYDEGRAIEREEIASLVGEAEPVVMTLLDFERRTFSLTFDEYELLPAPFFVYRRLLSEFRDEVRKREEIAAAKLRARA